MKQKNLWIAALALGITLSAHGQQSGGGISPTMLQQIKQSYQGTPTDKAIRNAITNNDINKLAVNGESKNNLDTYFSNKVGFRKISKSMSWKITTSCSVMVAHTCGSSIRTAKYIPLSS